MNKLVDLITRIVNKYNRYFEEKYLKYFFKKKGYNIPKSTIFYGMPIFRVINPNSINIGKNVVLCSDPKKNDIGVNSPIVISTLDKNAKIQIGCNTGISGAKLSAMSKIHIGENCLVGANAIIIDNDLHPINPNNRRYSKNGIVCREIIIENNVFIGANSIILKGVTIGENSVIGAGSVVTTNVDANSIYCGNPAKKIKEIN